MQRFRLAAHRAAATASATAAVLAAVLACGTAAQAAPVTYEGEFSRDDERFVFEFDLGGPSAIDAKTLSWALGGFAPVLTLFGPGGLLQQAVGSSNTCGPGSGAPDAASGFCWDAAFGGLFNAGRYTLVLTQDGNLALGDSLADGFQQDGQAHYTGTWYLGDDSRSFINVDGSARSGAWQLVLDLRALDVNGVPEPASWALCGLALAAALTAGSRHRGRRAGRHAPSRFPDPVDGDPTP
jgi:hypothetical protein